MSVTEHRQRTVRFGNAGIGKGAAAAAASDANNGWIGKDEVKAKRPSMWNIVFYNDDYTSMDFVVFVLTKIFYRSTEDALALTMAVHTQGKGIAGTFTFEVAEQKQCEVLLMAKIEEHPLRVEVEKV